MSKVDRKCILRTLDADWLRYTLKEGQGDNFFLGVEVTFGLRMRPVVWMVRGCILNASTRKGAEWEKCQRLGRSDRFWRAIQKSVRGSARGGSFEVCGCELAFDLVAHELIR